ncbi:hypothetical protein [[Ruminococcus] torques]|uniref:hypothetical protein n=1 Tax=[Ruminococcus] torques TaxID=33039 RepID=UPI00399B6F56
MKQEKQQEIALMRYGAIAPIIAGLDERYPSKTAFYTEISAKGLMGPDGKLHHYAPPPLKNGIWTIRTMDLKVSSRKGGQMPA